MAALGSLQSGRVTVQSRWHPAYDATSTKGTSSAAGFDVPGTLHARVY